MSQRSCIYCPGLWELFDNSFHPREYYGVIGCILRPKGWLRVVLLGSDRVRVHWSLSWCFCLIHEGKNLAREEQTLGLKKNYSRRSSSAFTLLFLSGEKCKTLWTKEIMKPQIQMHRVILLGHNKRSKTPGNFSSLNPPPRHTYTMECRWIIPSSGNV